MNCGYFCGNGRGKFNQINPSSTQFISTSDIDGQTEERLFNWESTDRLRIISQFPILYLKVYFKMRKLPDTVKDTYIGFSRMFSWLWTRRETDFLSLYNILR